MDTLPPSLQAALTEFILFLPSLVTSIVVFIATLVLAGFVRNLVSRALSIRRTDNQVVSLVSNLARWSVLITGTITALQMVNFDVTAFIAGLGVVGIAAGFALQDTLANFVAGILLLIQQPFRTGDLVEAGGFFGRIQTVDLRATRLITQDGKDVLIPNSAVLGGAVTNWTLTPLLRIQVDVSVAYESDLDQVERVTLGAVGAFPGLLTTPAPPVVWFHTFSPSSIDLTVHFWVDTSMTHRNEAKDEAIKLIKSAYEANGIEIPFPVRTILLPERS